MIKLPHKYPMLFVNEHEILSETEVTASYVVPESHPALEGHFPDVKIWPGVHLIEGMNQTAGLHAIYLAQEKGVDTGNYIAMVTTVNNAKFRAPVFPEAELVYHATLVKSMGRHVVYDCVVKQNGQKVAQATVGLTAR